MAAGNRQSGKAPAKRPPGKRPPVKRSPQVRRRGGKQPSLLLRLRRWSLLLALLLFLLGSLATLGYVLFFGSAQASEVPERAEAAAVPKVALIIDDMGYNWQIGEELLALPFPCSYSFLPFAPYSGRLAELAGRLGKTVLLHLPLEPKREDADPGPGALYLADSPALQREKFRRCLAEVPGAVGVNNHMGSHFTEDKTAMARLLRELRRRQLFFIDSFTTPDSQGLRLAGEMGVESTRRHVFLDNDIEADQICARLAELVAIAERDGVGVGIAHPHSPTLAALRSCAGAYQGRVDFVGIEAVLQPAR